MAMILVAAVVIFALPVLGLVAFVANKAMDGVMLFLTRKERKALSDSQNRVETLKAALEREVEGYPLSSRLAYSSSITLITVMCIGVIRGASSGFLK